MAARVAKRLKGPPGWAPADPLTPIMATPRIDTPLARHLIALAPSLLLPGVADLPDESVMAVRSNRKFIEALLVGANHEFNRELLWRGFPTEQRATPLRRFWDRSATPGGAADDIDAIDGWPGTLGSHMTGADAQVVLAVRGQLLRRYPGTVIYAMRAIWTTGATNATPTRIPDPGTEQYPAFSGTIDPDIAFVGFDFLTWPTGTTQPGGDPGWFFVFQQPPTDLRFGLDASAPEDGVALGWETLNWPDAQKNSAGYLRTGAAPRGIDPTQWRDLNSASLAGRCRQKRFRACIHASDLLEEQAP